MLQECYLFLPTLFCSFCINESHTILIILDPCDNTGLRTSYNKMEDSSAKPNPQP